MLGRTNAGGGGGGGLNFTVVNTVPSNPKENTIFVNTSTKITSYVFSTTQPSNPEPGMVWFSTGISSAVEFNALKKNNITVYPVSVKQYVNGGWVEKTAKTWNGSKWIDWIIYLYNAGNECTSLTGGWAQKSISYITGGTTRPNYGAVSRGSNSITLTAGAQTLSLIVTTNKISFDSATKIVFEGGTSSADSNEFGIASANTGELSAIRVARKMITTSNGTFELEIPSGVSSGYVYVMANGGNRTVTVNKVRLK
jgi:hypothetical protein